MSEKEIKLAKLTSLMAAIFIFAAYLLKSLGGWNNNLYEETSTILHFSLRATLGILCIGLIIHYFIMLRNMFIQRKWFWLMSSFIGVFFITLAYYLLVYPKKYESNI